MIFLSQHICEIVQKTNYKCRLNLDLEKWRRGLAYFFKCYHVQLIWSKHFLVF